MSEEELREKVADIFDNLCEPTNQFWHRDSALHQADKVLQLFQTQQRTYERKLVEARIEELGAAISGLRSGYIGSIKAIHQMKDRITELKQSLNTSKASEEK